MNSRCIFALLLISSLPLASANEGPLSDIETSTSTLTFSEAWERVRASDPALSAIAARVEAAIGRAEQAGLRPNPTVGVEVENILGSGNFRGLNAAELTLGLSQVIEGRRRIVGRIAVAGRERELIRWSEKERILTRFAETRQTFIAVLLTQSAVEVAHEFLTHAESVEKETERLNAAARVSQVELLKARLLRQERVFELARARRHLSSLRVVLASLWGQIDPPAFIAVGELKAEQPTDDLRSLIAALGETSALERFELEQAHRAAELELAEAQAGGPLELFAGARYSREGEGGAALVAGIEMPWRLHDRNQGNIRAARAQLTAVDSDRAARQRELVTALVTEHGRLTNAQSDLALIDGDLLPIAAETVAAAQERYTNGQSTRLDVLECQLQLIELRQRQLDALGRVAEALTAIDVITRPSQHNLSER